MVNSYVYYTGDGSTTNFQITFDYLSKEFVQVYLDGVLLEVETDYIFAEDRTILIPSIPPNGSIVFIRRVTSKDRLVEFRDASILVANDLDVSALQAIHIAEEANDNIQNVIQADPNGNFDALNRRLVNVDAPVDDTDGANKLYVDTRFAADVAAAEDARDASIVAQGLSEDARDASIVAQGLSEDARDASVVAQGLSEDARDASIVAQGLSEDARDAAQGFAIAAMDTIGTVGHAISGDKIITVADSGADFTTVMDAIAEAMKWRSIDGSVIVEIQSGYLVKEQLFFIDNDYSHINIKAQNGATIIVDHNSMSVTDFEGLGLSGFIVCARGKSPMFQAQFEFLTRPTNTISGALAIFNGEIYFGNNSGVKRAGGSGATGNGGGSITMGSGNDFSGAGRHGAQGNRGGSITMGDSNDFSGAGGSGATGNGGGSVTMGDGNDFSGAGGDGATGNGGGSVTMGSGNDFSGAGGDGAFGNRGGSVTMGDGNDFSGAGYYGAYGAVGGSVTMGSGNDFSGVSVGRHSFRVAINGLIRAGGETIFTTGRERSQAARTITTSGLIMG